MIRAQHNIMRSARIGLLVVFLLIGYIGSAVLRYSSAAESNMCRVHTARYRTIEHYIRDEYHGGIPKYTAGTLDYEAWYSDTYRTCAVQLAKCIINFEALAYTALFGLCGIVVIGSYQSVSQTRRNHA